MSETIAPKFFHVINCNRVIKSDGIHFHFGPYELVGTWMGVFKAVTPEEIAGLEKLAVDPKSGVQSLTEEQYNNCVKKKASASNSYTQSLAVTVPLRNEPAAPSVENNSVEPNVAPTAEPPVAPLESVSEAVEVVNVGRKGKAGNVTR